MKNRFLRLIAIIALALAPIIAGAKTRTFTEQNCSITIPDEKGWKDNKDIAGQSPSILVAAQDSAGTKLVVLMTQELPPEIDLHTPGVLDTLRSQVKTQGTVRREGYAKLGGVEAYEFVLTESDGQTSHVITTAAEVRLYTLTVAVATGDVEKEKELAKIVSSFKFLRKPKAAKQ